MLRFDVLNRLGVDHKCDRQVAASNKRQISTPFVTLGVSSLHTPSVSWISAVLLVCHRGIRGRG